MCVGIHEEVRKLMLNKCIWKINVSGQNERIILRWFVHIERTNELQRKKE